MGPGLTSWLAPVAAAAAVLATVLGPALVGGAVTTRPGTGPSPSPSLTVDRRLPRDRLVLPAPRPGDRRDSRVPHDVEITGYQGAGRWLTVFYRVAPRSDCSAEVRRPDVIEMPLNVSVRLERVAPGRPEELCEGQPLSSSVDVRLAAPLAGRVVQDMARRGALVPIERPFRSLP